MLSGVMKSVILYTTERCSKCVSAKALLQQRGIAFVEVNLARDPDGRDALMRRTGMVTFPQIVVGEELLGGFRELMAADHEGRLTDLVATKEPAAEEPAPTP
jgi:glutaredoxin 3